jgi:site-specific DNA-cytosine methylase
MSRVLIACEFSGIVRDAFRAHGHDATSCDLLDSERPGKHYHGDVLYLLKGRQGTIDAFDLLVAFPPCTHLSSSGARWFSEKSREQFQALRFVADLLDANVSHIALENPIGVISRFIRPPDQIIQPWQFGHGETKATCLWLKNLPQLVPTNIVAGREGRVWKEAPGQDRWKNRSRTLQGIADAMAEQWGDFVTRREQGVA